MAKYISGFNKQDRRKPGGISWLELYLAVVVTLDVILSIWDLIR